MKRLFSVLLCLLTGVGGHYLNRRYDRAVFFLGLLFAWNFVILLLVQNASGGDQDPAEVAGYARVIVGGLALILIVSAAMAWRDAGRQPERTSQPGVTGVLGAILTSLMALGLVFYDLTAATVGLSGTGAGRETTARAPRASTTVSPDAEDAMAFAKRSDSDRLNAAVVLIRNGMFEEAGVLLERVSSADVAARRLAIRGYLLARQDRCEEAHGMFAQALRVNASVYIPREFNIACENVTPIPHGGADNGISTDVDAEK